MQAPTGKKFSLGERLRSFKFAFRGIEMAVRTQHNFRIHLAAFILVTVAGFLLRISPGEWCIVIIASALVISLEIINTAMELTVDIISPEFREKAGMIKDLSAAAVLVAATASVLTGVIIFGKHILQLLNMYQ
jgi:diacylglycerol kinase